MLQKLLCKGFWWSLKGLTECVRTLFSKNDFRPSCGNVHMQKPLLPVEGDCVIFLMQSPSISRADFCMCIVQFYKVENIFPQCFQLPINVFSWKTKWLPATVQQQICRNKKLWSINGIACLHHGLGLATLTHDKPIVASFAYSSVCRPNVAYCISLIPLRLWNFDWIKVDSAHCG